MLKLKLETKHFCIGAYYLLETEENHQELQMWILQIKFQIRFVKALIIGNHVLEIAFHYFEQY
jgi:hypothetical protein